MAKKKEKEVEATPESKVAEITKEIAKVEKLAIVEVKTEADYEEASKFLSGTVKPRVNRIKELIKFFTDPYVEQRRVALENKQKIEAMFEKQVVALENIESATKKAMSVFLRIKEEEARKEEERLRKLQEKKNERREEKGQELDLTPAPSVERVDTTIKNEEGGKTVAKKVWKFEIENYSLLSKDVQARVFELARDKGLVDQVVRDLVRAGTRELAGVRIYEDFDISASAGR